MKKIVFLLVLLFCATTAFAQSVVYHTAKYINNGVESPANPTDVTFRFDGNDVFIYFLTNYPPSRYRYDHHENGNAVYYMMATNYGTYSQGGTSLVQYKDSWLIFNSDKSVANTGSRYNNSITVYKRGSGTQSIGKMYE